MNNAPLNLLPVATLRRQAIRQSLSVWAYIGGCAMLLLIGMTIHQELLTARVDRRLAALTDSYDATHADLQEVKRLRREIEEVRDRHGATLSLTRERPLLPLLGIFSSAARANSDGVAIGQFAFSSDEAPQPGNTSSRTPAVLIELRGVAANPMALAEFVSAIQGCNVFTRVELTSTGAIRIRDQAARSYTIECAHEGSGS